MAILSSHSHSLSLSLSLATCQRITFSLSRPPSWVLWCYFSSMPATAAHNKHSQPVCLRLLSYSLATLCIHLSIYLYFWEKSSQKIEEETYSISMYSSFRGLLQISPLLTNESLEGCTLQSLSSDAVTTSTTSKSCVKPLL